jgi:hypothetical protein
VNRRVRTDGVAESTNELPSQCGWICFKGRKVNLSHVVAGQNVGVTRVGERI